MINNLLFDIDDTLFPSSEFAALARRNAVRAMIRMGLHATEDELLEMLGKIIEEKGSNYPRHFDLLLKRIKGRKIESPARFVAAATGAYHDTKAAIQPYPDVPRTLLEMKELGYRLYVATNGISVKQWDKLIRLGIALYFDEVFVSEELGIKKGPAFFRYILKKIKAEPKECVMIGDREDMDILPAKAVGLYTIRIMRGKYSTGPSKADVVLPDFKGLISSVLNLSR